MMWRKTMTIDERLSFFGELIGCNYEVYLWCYTPDLTLLHTNCPPGNVANGAVFLKDFSSALLDYVKSGERMPLILDTLPGLLYIAAFEYNGALLNRIHIMGPAFTGRNSHLLLKKEIDNRDYSVRLRSAIFRQLDHVPIIPTNQLYQYTVMFHYCITEEHITTNDIQFSPGSDTSAGDELNMISEEHRGVWTAEQALLKMFRDGNPDYKKALEQSTSLSSGVKYETGDTIRQQKNNLLVLLTLCSRAAIEGGVNPSVADTLHDLYAGQIEDSRTTSALSSLARTMMEEFIRKVQETKEHNGISPQIQAVCDYITMHPKEKFSINEFAKRTGYTEYYFSHKFKQETGKSIAEYIRSAKIEYACILLAGTHMGIQEIGDELGFTSRSYFSSSFQKEIGMSPSEYRRKNSRT